MNTTASRFSDAWLSLASDVIDAFEAEELAFADDEWAAKEVWDAGDFVIPDHQEVAAKARERYVPIEEFDREAIRERASQTCHEVVYEIVLAQLWEAAERRQAERDEEALRLDALVTRAAEVVSEALGHDMTQSVSGSWYLHFRGIKIRVSDHPQKPGGGWNEATGKRMGEADMQWVIDEEADVPTTDQVRISVAKLLWENR